MASNDDASITVLNTDHLYAVEAAFWLPSVHVDRSCTYLAPNSTVPCSIEPHFPSNRSGNRSGRLHGASLVQLLGVSWVTRGEMPPVAEETH